jgi:hypothetical protein
MQSHNRQAITSHSKEVIEVPVSRNIPSQSDVEFIKTLATTGSPIVFLILLGWFFNVLTHFIKVCKEN